MRDKRVWDTVNKMPVYPKKLKKLTEEEVKRVLLDYSEVNPECPESVRKYGERATMVGELYGYKKLYEKSQKDQNTTECTTSEIERLIGYKDEYIGKAKKA